MTITRTWANVVTDTWPGDAQAYNGAVGGNAVYDPIRRKIVHFGGLVAAGTCSNETWLFDVDTEQWSQASPATSPAARWHAGMVWDATNGRVLLFGGGDGTDCLSDLHEWTGTNWNELIADGGASSPAQRASFAMASDGAKAVVYGGYKYLGGLNVGFTSDTWELDFSTDTWADMSSTTPGNARYGVMAYDRVNGRFLMVAGGDLWSWETSWTQISYTGATLDTTAINAISWSEPDSRIMVVNTAIAGADPVYLLYGEELRRIGDLSTTVNNWSPNALVSTTPGVSYYFFNATTGGKTDKYAPTADIGLTDATGRHYNIFLKIDGLEPILWHYSHRGAPQWSRSIITCLEEASEMSMDLDLSEMKSGLSTMTFTLNDYKDSDGLSYFGQLFAPGAYDAGSVRYVAAGTSYNQVIDADATTIPLQSMNSLTAPGYLHCGQEYFHYQDIDGGNLTGCTRGLYPCVGSRWAHTIQQPEDGQAGYLPPVTTDPYTWIGRRCALYVTSWDDVAEDWCPESEAELVWVGRLSNKILFKSAASQWVLSCTSIMSDLDKKIAQDLPTTTLRGINLQGAWGRHFSIEITGIPYSGDETVRLLHSGDFEVTAGYYKTPDDLASEINDQLSDTSNWTTYGYPVGSPLIEIQRSVDGQSFDILAAFVGDNYRRTIKVYQKPLPKYHFCHALNALGFLGQDSFSFDAEAGSFLVAGTHSGKEPYSAYHPLHLDYNGGYIYLDRAAALWADQGDDTTTHAWVKIKKARLNEYDEDGAYHARYTGTDNDTVVQTSWATLDRAEFTGTGSGFAGEQEGSGKPAEVKNVYVPTHELTPTSGDSYDVGTQRRGPFRILLDSLLSTGTDGYNGDYDCLPLALSCAIQEGLVDVGSFLAADAAIGDQSIAQRYFYVIDEPIAWSELAKRECQLFGYVVVWDLRQGKLSLAPVASPAVDTAAEVITESVRANMDEWPDMDIGLDPVVNQYECEVDYDTSTGKYGPKVVITDVQSVLGLDAAKVCKIKHPGVWIPGLNLPIKDLLDMVLQRRWYAQPVPIVHVSLAHVKIKKITNGAVVTFRSTRVMDPLGSGTRTTDVTATVLSTKWNYGGKDGIMFTGDATLMLHARNQGQGQPIGFSAVVNEATTGGDWDTGYNNTDKQLSLKSTAFGQAGDTDDGGRIYSGFGLLITEEAPADPSNPQSWTDIGAASDYETDGAGILTLNTTLASWDGANKTYVVVPIAYPSASSAEVTNVAWMAADGTALLGASSNPNRYG